MAKQINKTQKELNKQVFDSAFVFLDKTSTDELNTKNVNPQFQQSVKRIKIN